MSDAVRYGPAVAVDLLDELGQGRAPAAAAVVQGAIALALHTADEPDQVVLLVDLERLVLEGRALDAAGLERAARVASRLRRRVGVH